MIATWIKRMREQRGMTAAELARALGVPSGTVSRWETGERVPSASMCVRLARVFGTDPHEVLRLAGREKPAPAYLQLHELVDRIERYREEELALIRSFFDRIAVVFVPVVGNYPAEALQPYPTGQVTALAEEAGDDPIALKITTALHPRFGVVPGDHVIVDRSRQPEPGDPCLLAGTRLRFAWRVERDSETWWIDAENGLPIRDETEIIGTVVTMRPTGDRRYLEVGL
jgi:transcriptional regulator with XRE-family HTH domain